jgi:von Willebrand factor type A domain/Bacterial extracellular solute-binding protein
LRVLSGTSYKVGADVMARHRARRRRISRLVAVLLGVAAVAVTATAVALLRDPATTVEVDEPDDAPVPDETHWCATLRVVAASSFAPVLADVAPLLATGDNCVRLDVEAADGRSAAAVLTEFDAHVWIPDDAAWAGVVPQVELDTEAETAGTIVATSPIYMVADDDTAARVTGAGGGWLDLADLLTADSGIRLVVRDPAGSGDGMLGAGAVGEAVWLEAGMDASAEALMVAFPRTETVTEPALPTEAGDVGLVPEYALATMLARDTADAAVVRSSSLLAGTDYSALMRYSWWPVVGASQNAAVAAAMDRVLDTLVGSTADDARAAAGLRNPAAEPLPGPATDFPELGATPFDVLGPHHVEHVFATWYDDDRTADVLVVIDVSGSMAALAPGSGTPLIDVVRAGVLDLVELLPNDSEVALWQFGALVDGERDYVELVPRAALDAAQRERLDAAVDAMTAINTGTGLYDTTVAAYLDARDNYRDGVPGHVIVFTDGRNEDRPGSIAIDDLTTELAAANDSARPIELTVITFGDDTDADLLATALEPVPNYVARISTADEVRAVFIHLAAGGRH